jgi:hypothetical protein
MKVRQIILEYNFYGSDLKKLLKACCASIDYGEDEIEDMIILI